MSGASNVGFWLRQRGIEASEDLVAAVLQEAKRTTHLMTDEQVMAVVGRAQR